MTDLRNQRRMAAQVLGVGATRVWIDPLHAEEVAAAVTRQDMRGLVGKGFVRKLQAQGPSRGRARALAIAKSEGKRKGPGSREGAKGSRAREPGKQRWLRTIRPLRQTLQLLRDEQLIDTMAYRRFYRRAKGGVFRSRPHLLSHLVTEGLLTEEQARDVRQRAEQLRAESFGKPAPGSRATLRKQRGLTPRERAEAKAAREARREARKAKEEPEAPPEEPGSGAPGGAPESPPPEGER